MTETAQPNPRDPQSSDGLNVTDGQTYADAEAEAEAASYADAAEAHATYDDAARGKEN